MLGCILEVVDEIDHSKGGGPVPHVCGSRFWFCF
jgi:hypothetical protein